MSDKEIPGTVISKKEKEGIKAVKILNKKYYNILKITTNEFVYALQNKNKCIPANKSDFIGYYGRTCPPILLCLPENSCKSFIGENIRFYNERWAEEEVNKLASWFMSKQEVGTLKRSNYLFSGALKEEFDIVEVSTEEAMKLLGYNYSKLLNNAKYINENSNNEINSKEQIECKD